MDQRLDQRSAGAPCVTNADCDPGERAGDRVRGGALWRCVMMGNVIDRIAAKFARLRTTLWLLCESTVLAQIHAKRVFVLVGSSVVGC
jgi:hypothetical protein